MANKPMPLSNEEECIAKEIVDASFTVHKQLGPGLLESVYEVCLCHELGKRNLAIERQVVVPIYYDNIVFDEGFRLDVVVEDLVICELKAIEAIKSVHTAQLLSCLKLIGKRLGFLINFNVPIIKHGIRRIIL